MAHDLSPTSRLPPLLAAAEALLVDDGVHGAEGTSDLSAAERRYFRLGSVGSVSTLHYDEYHNVFVQVGGSKRVWLLPPSAWLSTLGFPKGHERYRQSPRRSVFDWPDAERRNASLGLRAVTLQPGDALYIPPFWYHQTLTLRRSSAVNVWSPSAEAMVAAQAGDLGGGLTTILAATTSKGDALCATTCLALALATRLTQGDPPTSPTDAAAASELLHSLHRVQHSHLRSARRKRTL